MAAATDAVPRRLCPHPWPGSPSTRAFFSGTSNCERPGSASYSAMMPMIGLPEPHDATNAVGMPATPSCTSNPAAFSSATCAAALLVSLYPTSEYSQILRERSP